ncbi:MAG: type IV pilus modification protein PilV [Gammaproteobacteria bacterium]|nr:type IV pilus modification protein PilV [Gammaproteobacteria bacterium]
MRSDKGFSLLEFLVALFLTAVAILGFFSLQSRTQLSTLEVMQRDEALRIARNMVELIQANPEVADCFAFSSYGVDYLGTGYTGGSVSCAAFGTNETRSRPETDLVRWNLMLQGFGERSSSNEAIGSLVDARGCVYGPADVYDSAGNLVSSTDFYEVVVVYQGASGTVVPSTPCGQGLYGTDTFRRAVRLYVRLAELDS